MVSMFLHATNVQRSLSLSLSLSLSRALARSLAPSLCVCACARARVCVGISAANLVEWNALTLALDAPGPRGEAILIDYVIIQLNN